MNPSGRTLLVTAALALGLSASPAPSRAEWLAPDPSYRDAQVALRIALRDTAGHADDPGRLDTLAVAQLQLGRFDDARALFERVRTLSPADEAARAGLGKLALFEDRLAAAESLLVGLPPANDDALRDLYAARLRRGEWAEAATLAEAAGQPGRAALLTEMATGGAYVMSGAPEKLEIPWARAYPIPLIKARINGQSMLLAVSTAVADLMLDVSAARRCKVTTLPAEAPVYWSGTRTAARMAVLQRLELGGLRIERVPAAVTSLRRYSLYVNPQGEAIGGVIGFNLLRRFTSTLDYEHQTLTLRSGGVAEVATGARRIPLEVWGESGPTVYGTIASGRRMAMLIDTGIPECGVGAPRVVFEELGLKSGALSRAVRGAGAWINAQPWTAVTAPTVTVGTLSRGKVEGWSGALDPSELWSQGVRRDALLSSQFFKDLRVTFDWAARELVVEE